MLTPNELLTDDERLIGNYNAQVARWREGAWLGTLPTLYLIVTDRRMILQPQTRKRYDPAIIPRRYVSDVNQLVEGIRHGIILRLKTGHQIGMFIPDDPNQRLYDFVKTCFLPPTPITLKTDVDVDDIQRLIAYFDHL